MTQLASTHRPRLGAFHCFVVTTLNSLMMRSVTDSSATSRNLRNCTTLSSFRRNTTLAGRYDILLP
jgi:hypothetical protein